MKPALSPRPHVLCEATYRQLLDAPPAVALLPWGGTEAHSYHLPHGTDIFESEALAEEGARYFKAITGALPDLIVEFAVTPAARPESPS